MEVRTQQSGRLEDVAPLDLLQSLGIYRRAGHVVFSHAYGHSRLWFEGGEIVDAESGALRGAAAVYRIVTLDRGEFRVEVTGESRGRTIERSGSGLIFEAAYRIDEGKRLRERLPAIEAVLARPGAAVIHCPTETHVQLAALLDAGATLGEVLERSGLGELETLQWITELVEAGRLHDTGAVRSPEPPASDGLAGSVAWPLGPDASHSFVPSPSFMPPPSFASHAEREDAETPRRRWWIHASLGAAVAAVVTLVIVWSNADASSAETAASLAVESSPVAVIEEAVPVEPAPREHTVAVGASATEQLPVSDELAELAELEDSPSKPAITSKGKALRGRDRAVSSPDEAAVAMPVQPEPQAEVAEEPEDASVLLVEARGAYASGRGATAYRLASRSHALRPTSAAAELMALAACQQQRPDAAAEALRSVPLLRRANVRAICKQEHGVRVKVLSGGS